MIDYLVHVNGNIKYDDDWFEKHRLISTEKYLK